MKRCQWTMLSGMIAVLMTAGLLRAEPMNFARVPTDAMWVAHIDIAAAVNSQYGQLAITDMQSLGLDRKIEAIKSLMELDPLKDFDSVTAFGQSLGDKEGTLIVQMGPTTGKLEQIAKLAQQYQRDDYKQCVIHSWIDEKKGKHEGLDVAGQRVYCGVMAMTGAGKTLLIFSPDMNKVKASIDQLEADKPGVVGRFAAKPAAGSIVFVAVENIDQLVAKQPDHPAVLNVIKALTCDIGETDGNAYLSMSMRTTDAQQAANLRQMAMGLLAMVKMSEDPTGQPLADLANKINVTSTGDAVSVNVRYPSKKLYELMKQLKAQHEQRKQSAIRQRDGTPE